MKRSLVSEPGEHAVPKRQRGASEDDACHGMHAEEYGRVIWYNGRRQTGRVLTDDGRTLIVPHGAAQNRNLVPLTPGGLMHGTRVSCIPMDSMDAGTGRGVHTCLEVRPCEGALQPGLACGVEKRTAVGMRDRNHLAAADVVDLGFFAGLFDGHRGGSCANYVARQFSNLLHSAYVKRTQAVKGGMASLTTKAEAELISETLRGAFEAADHSFMKAAKEKHWTDGSSALVALLAHGFEAPGKATVMGTEGGVAKLFLAWCGDSRALLLRGKEVLRLTKDHTPGRKDEYTRIKEAGGKVLDFDGVLKVGRYDKYKERKTSGSFKDLLWLPTCRSFGDIRLKVPYPVVTSEPELLVHTLTPEDWAVVLICKGITRTLSDQDVADACWAKALEGPVEMAKELVHRAEARGPREPQVN
eukprot:CAMPEP_0117556224 /NCGR_PEP_ID=MMETSP0784-20121206/51692_1 /TAXON_ID=39447 /ORGANISM="" /LENGTH=413 /DNA_ID=CAMNT_0005353479 /DNA_START=57 /DNA_END=1295 /DNA_ORIENTATION=+